VNNIKRGDRFAHKSMIVGSPKAGTARPDICMVTRVARGMFYYRNESGMLFCGYVQDGLPGTKKEQ
jgi:hypothetical protein